MKRRSLSSAVRTISGQHLRGWSAPQWLRAAHLWALAVVSLVLPYRLGAQSVSSTGGTNESFWFNYFGDHPVTDHLSMHLEGSYRRTFEFDQFEQYYVRPGLTVVESPHWQSLLAYTFQLSNPTAGGSFGPAPIAQELPEHRALEQQIFEHRISGNGDRAITLAHRFRMEQRWQGTEIQGQGVANWNFSERARYRITLHIPVGAGPSPARYVTAFDEVYTGFGPHGGKQPFYANVTYAALGIKTGKFYAVEVGYQYRLLAQPGGITGTSDNSIQMMLLSNLPFRRGTHQPSGARSAIERR